MFQGLRGGVCVHCYAQAHWSAINIKEKWVVVVDAAMEKMSRASITPHVSKDGANCRKLTKKTPVWKYTNSL